MKKKEKQSKPVLSTYHVDPFLLKTLKIKILEYDFTLRNFYNAAAHLFVSSSDFREKIFELTEVDNDN